MNYDEMSDLEINKAVADQLGLHWHLRPSESGTNQWSYSNNYEECNTLECSAIDSPDYCNNPSDAWPIIIENNINIISPNEAGGVMWEAHWTSGKWDFSGCYVSFSNNPLRAAMIVFLMMQDGKS